MQIEATGKPIRYRLRSGEEILLRRGEPVTLPDKSARALLRKAGPQVRLVLSPGNFVEWESPALPNSRAEVLEVDVPGARFCAYHPRTSATVWLPLDWIVAVWSLAPLGTGEMTR